MDRFIYVDEPEEVKIFDHCRFRRRDAGDFCPTHRLSGGERSGSPHQVFFGPPQDYLL